MPTLFGSAIKRREDPRLITGAATYVDDVKLPGLTYAAILRSPYAHARITFPAPGTSPTATSRSHRIRCSRTTRCATWATASRWWLPSRGPRREMRST
jgi:hypothetical protein